MHEDERERVLRALPGAVYQHTRTESGDERFSFVSDRACEIFGLSPDASSCDPAAVWARVHPADRRFLSEAVAHSATDMAPVKVEVRIGDEQQGYRWLRIHASPERTACGITWTAVALDVTEQRTLEEALRHAQRREAMAELAAGIAHNFNNMLAVILPSLEIALRSERTPVELLRDAQAAASRAADLVRELLALSRGNGSGDGDAVTDLASVARDVVRICRMTFDRSISIGARIAAEPALVRGKPNHLHQALLNLCLNARDALRDRDAAELAVEVEREYAADGSEVILVRVRDNGSGMDEATLERIGQPFFTTKPAGLGTGLGLASVFGTVRELGGTIDCTSKSGAGTTFTLRLPALGGAAVRPSSAPPQAQAPVRSQRVLLVDDEPLVRTVLRRLLEFGGREVVEAARGDEALERVGRDGPFDVVLLDLSLPGLPGAKVLAELRAHYPALPVIILSGYVARESALSGAAAVLEKPVSLAQLNEVLERVVDAP